MQWKITTGSDRDAGNVQNYTGTEGRSVFVDVTHPGVGPDAVVEIIDVSTQRVLVSVSCGFSDQGPKQVEFSPIADGTRSYNLIVKPIGGTFGTPGIIISANETSNPVETPYTYTPSTQTTAFAGPVTAPNVNGQTYSSATGITTMPGSVVQSGGLLRLNGMNRVFANFRKALMRSNIGGGNLRIGLVGDSTIAAMGAVNGGTNVAGCRPRSIGKHFSDMMSSTLGLPGNRDSVFGSGVVSNGADYTTYTAYDPRVVFTGAVGFDSVGGTLGAQPFKFTTTGQVLTFTPDNAFTKIRIYSINNQGTFGSVRVSVGGVDKADIVSSGGTGFLTTTITASGNAVVITALETKTFDLIGIETWDDTKPGISVLEMGWSGSFMSSMAGNANAYSHARALASLNLDCVILKCTTNDCIAPTSKAAYLASLQQFISLQPITCDIFFADLFPSSYQDAKPGVLDGYRDAAVEAGLPVLDLREMYGQSSTEAISTGLAIGAVHPGEIAYATIARMYSERLRPWI